MSLLPAAYHFATLPSAELKSALGPILDVDPSLGFRLDDPKLDFHTLSKLGLEEDAAEGLLNYLNEWIQGELDPTHIQNKATELGATEDSVARLGFYLKEIIQFNQIVKNPSLIPVQKGSLPDGQEIELSAVSIAGGQRCTNSDSFYLQKKPGSRLIAGIADGISGSKLDQAYQTGKVASRAAMHSIRRNQALLDQEIDTSKIMSQEHLTDTVSNLGTDDLLRIRLSDLLNPLNDDSPHAQKIFHDFLPWLLKPSLHEGQNPNLKLREIYRIIHKKSDNDKTPGLELIKYFKQATPENILKAVLVDDYQDLIRVFDLLEHAGTDMKEKASNLFQSGYYPELSERIDFGTTVSLVIDKGDSILLVSAGDSNSFAYNERGIIKDSQNDIHTKTVKGKEYISSCLSIEYSPPQVKSMLHPNSFTRHFDNKYSLHKGGLNALSIRRIKKADLKGIVLCTDGVCKASDIKNRSFLNRVDAKPQETQLKTPIFGSYYKFIQNLWLSKMSNHKFNASAQSLAHQAMLWASNHENGDDKTVVVIGIN